MKTWMCALMLALSTGASAQNPIISGQYSADPTARVFNGKMYLYPSHDIPSPIEKLKEWFCMADYHVFSSSNLTEWQDHGVIVSQDKVPWVQDGSYTMWAPDCVEKNGKYYFYFPAAPKGEEKGVRNRCGGCRPAGRTIYADVETHRGGSWYRPLCADR